MKRYKIIISCVVVIFMLSCSMTHTLQKTTPTADIHLPSNGPVETPEIEDVEKAVTELQKISSDNQKDSAYLVEVERDSTGEMTIRGEDIKTVYIVAKSKNVAERNGEIAIDFIVGIPTYLQSTAWGLVITPVVESNGKEEILQPVSIRGELFSELQKRQYWQMNKYLNKVLGDSTELSTTTSLVAKYYEAYNRYLSANQKRRAAKLESTYKQTISFPYISDPRLDSVLIRKGEIQYYYTQKYRPTKSTHRLHLYFRGRVDAIDRSYYDLANSDTLTYTVTSMLSLLDNRPRYMLKVIDKYIQVNDRNYITFKVNQSRIIDTLGQNSAQLSKIEHLMDTLINQYEFFVDSITITASSSPEGTIAVNERISDSRAKSIKDRLVNKFGHEVDELIRTRSVGEDWQMLRKMVNNNYDLEHWKEIVGMIDKSENYDATEYQIRRKYPTDYAYMREAIYPQLRAVDFKYYLRRVDMIKDTIMLTVLDTTYMRGVQELKDREYVKALRTLNDYKCQNLAVTLLSLGYDEAAFDILEELPSKDKSAKTDYLCAIALSRINKPKQGLEYYLKAIKADPILKFRGNLDPEIQILYKQNNVKSTAFNDLSEN